MPTPRLRRLGSARAAPLLLVLAAACSKDITVHLRTGDKPPDPNHAATHPHEAAVFVASALAAGVAIDRVQLVLRDLRMQANPTTDGSPAPGDQPLGPSTLLVDLAGDRLAPGAMTEIVPARSVTWTTFYQTVLELRPVSADEVAADAALGPLQGRTLVVTGRLPGGAPFTFESAMAGVLVRPAVFRTGLNHNNLTVNLAPNRWFEGPSGEPLDPTDPAAHASIEANILGSFDAYMDDDLDGVPDFLG